MAKNNNATALADFHSTRPGGKPGTNAVFASYSPRVESATLATYISNKCSVTKIIYSKAGVEYPGALEDYCNLNGITSITAEVKSAHGTIASGTISKSYEMMKAFLNYYKVY